METKDIQNILKKLFDTFPNYNSVFDETFPSFSTVFYEFTTQYFIPNSNVKKVVPKLAKYLNDITDAHDDSLLLFIIIDCIFYPIYNEEDISQKVLNELDGHLKKMFIKYKKEQKYSYLLNL